MDLSQGLFIFTSPPQTKKKKKRERKKADKLSGKASTQGNLRMDKEKTARATLDRLYMEDEMWLWGQHAYQEDGRVGGGEAKRIMFQRE